MRQLTKRPTFSYLNILADESDLCVRGLVVVKVSERSLEHSALKTVGGDLGTLGAGHKGLANLALQLRELGVRV